jgi:hypothetical protein
MSAPLPYHAESAATVPAAAGDIFAFLDDHARLASHMSRRSLMMGGGRMRVETDAGRGQAVGSHIRLAGRAFGIPLSLDEVVVLRSAPTAKTWETTGVPNLLVIGPYRMGFELAPSTQDTAVRVFIDYALPKSRLPLPFLERLAAGYARWCTDRMVKDAVRLFPGPG